MNATPLTTTRPELMEIVQQINDRLLGKLRSMGAADLAPGSIFPKGILMGRMPRGGIVYNGSALPTAELLDVPTSSGQWLRWRLDYVWDGDEKLIEYRLTDPDSVQQGKWSIIWEWDGFEWYVTRIDAQVRT